MKRVVGGLLAALPGLASVAAIIGLIFYVSAVIATKLFAAEFPQWFGSLGASAFTLFQVMTLESWAMGIVRPVMEVYPAAWIFFLVFILASTFTLLNLFIAVIVNAIQNEASSGEQAGRVENPIALRSEIDDLRDLLRETQLLLERTRKDS
jgi:voltage-gated sodium channel